MKHILRVCVFVITLFGSKVCSLTLSTSTDLLKQLNCIQAQHKQIAKLFNVTVSMEQRLTELQEENERLKRNVTSMAVTQISLTETNIELERELTELKQKVARSPHAVWDVQGNISYTRNDPSAPVESLTSLQQSMATFRDDLTYLHNENVALQNTTVHLMESFNGSLQQQIKDRLTIFEGEKQSLASSITSLTNKLRANRGFTVQNAQAIENIGHHQVVVFDQVTTNLGGRYYAKTGTFIADINGWYIFFFDIRVRYYNQLCWSELVKNNAAIVLTYGLSGGRLHDHNSESNMAVLHVQVGDQIWIRSSSDDNASCGIDDHSSFSGFLLNAD